MKNYSLNQAAKLIGKAEMKNIKKELEASSRKRFYDFIYKETGQKISHEVKFCPSRKWRLDFAIKPMKIAIEIEGGIYKKTTYKDKKTGAIKTHLGGRHNTAKGFKNDMEKYNELSVSGWILIRITPDEMYSDKIISLILKSVEYRTLKVNNAT